MDRDRWPGEEPTLGSPGDVGRDAWREAGDEPTPAWRDRAPDPLAPIDPNAPVSGHVAGGPVRSSIVESPEHDWAVARTRLYPLLRPAGTAGVRVEELDVAALAAEGLKSHAQPLVDEGPAGLAVVYGISVGEFDIIANADHLLGWGVATTDIQDAALANLAAWSASTPWADERSGARRLLSSQSGDGWDASRVLLPDVRDHLASTLGADGRVLVGLPERHLLVAATLRPDDAPFAALFADFVLEQSGQADEPIDRRVFELVGRDLVPFVA